MASSEPKLSRREQELFELLPADGGRISSADLVTKFYGHQPPLYARQNVVAVMHALMLKFDRSDSQRRVRQSKRRGPHPVEYWVE